MEHQEDENLSVGRQRKKKLIGEVKDLMEFYFSSVNLRKDKFMNELLQKDSFIDLNIFHRFNKIKALTKDTKLLQKAIKNSEILQLSEDGLKVCRIAPMEMKNDEDACTVYVENLPPNSTHDWLSKVFSLYGSIDYISLPRFQQTGRPKGFAFIEFRTPQEAQKSLEAFGGLASLDGTLYPEDLLTIKTYKQVREGDTIEMQEDTSSKDDEFTKKRSADEAFTDVGAECDDAPQKKQKVEDVGEKSDPDIASVKKKKKRKRNKKGKVYEPDSVYLKVMSKKEWKMLRNKYLNTQRKNMKQLKLQMYYTNNCNSQQIDRQNMQQPDATIDMVNKSPQIPQYLPDVIVKIALSEPPENPKSFQKGLKTGRQSIAYIDASTESKDVYVRFKASDEAKQFVKEKLWDKVCLLQGEDEKSYWQKLIDSWHQKRPKNKKPHMTNEADILVSRGRDKLVTKALRHNSFDNTSSRVVFDE